MDKHFQILLLGLMVACVCSRFADQSQVSSRFRERGDVFYNSAAVHHQNALNYRRYQNFFNNRQQDDRYGKYHGNPRLGVKRLRRRKQRNVVEALLKSTTMKVNANRRESVEDSNDQQAEASGFSFASSPIVVAPLNATRNRLKKRYNPKNKKKVQKIKDTSVTKIEETTKPNFDLQQSQYYFGQKDTKRNNYKSHSFASFKLENTDNSYLYSQPSTTSKYVKANEEIESTTDYKTESTTKVYEEKTTVTNDEFGHFKQYYLDDETNEDTKYTHPPVTQQNEEDTEVIPTPEKLVQKPNTYKKGPYKLIQKRPTTTTTTYFDYTTTSPKIEEVNNIHSHLSSLYKGDEYPIKLEDVSIYQRPTTTTVNQHKPVTNADFVSKTPTFSQPITSVKYNNDLYSVKGGKVHKYDSGANSESKKSTTTTNTVRPFRLVTKYYPGSALPLNITDAIHAKLQAQKSTNLKTQKYLNQQQQQQQQEKEIVFNDQILSAPIVIDEVSSTPRPNYKEQPQNTFSVSNYPFVEPDGRVQYKTQIDNIGEAHQNKDNGTSVNEDRSSYHDKQVGYYVPRYPPYAPDDRQQRSLQQQQQQQQYQPQTDMEKKYYLLKYDHPTENTNFVTPTNSPKPQYSAYLIDNSYPHKITGDSDAEVYLSTVGEGVYSNGWKPITSAPDYHKNTPNVVQMQDLYYQAEKFHRVHKHVPIITDRSDSNIEEPTAEKEFVVTTNYDVAEDTPRNRQKKNAGEYSVMLPDSSLLIIKYVVHGQDGGGFLGNSGVPASYDGEFLKKHT